MNWISGAFFLLAAHSLVMAIFVPLNKEWYCQKAYQAGVTPNVAQAVTMKLLLSAAAIGVGIWQLD